MHANLVKKRNQKLPVALECMFEKVTCSFLKNKKRQRVPIELEININVSQTIQITLKYLNKIEVKLICQMTPQLRHFVYLSIPHRGDCQVGVYPNPVKWDSQLSPYGHGLKGALNQLVIIKIDHFMRFLSQFFCSNQRWISIKCK